MSQKIDQGSNATTLTPPHSAGVAGLTTALLLSRNANYSITVAAKHMPGDYDIEYASPWAGANYLPLVTEFFLPNTYRLQWTRRANPNIILGFLLQTLSLRSGTKIRGLNWKDSLNTIQRLACIFKVSAHAAADRRYRLNFPKELRFTIVRKMSRAARVQLWQWQWYQIHGTETLCRM